MVKKVITFNSKDQETHVLLAVTFANDLRNGVDTANISLTPCYIHCTVYIPLGTQNHKAGNSFQQTHPIWVDFS